MSIETREAIALIKKLMDVIDAVEEHELLEEARAWLMKNGDKE